MSYFCSWSGGKDSCLALHRAMGLWGPPDCLVTMLAEGGRRSRSHGLPHGLLQAQADAIGVPLLVGAATWEDYEGAFVELLLGLRDRGVTMGVFGDIDLQEHRDWEQKVCGVAGMQAALPLWQEDHRALVDELLALGYQAVIVTLNTDLMPERYLGRVLTPEFVEELGHQGIDVAGEAGQFHTFVFDGPVFGGPVPYRVIGPERLDQYAILELA